MMALKEFPSSNEKIQANILFKHNQSCDVRSTCYFKKNTMSWFSLLHFSYITSPCDKLSLDILCSWYRFPFNLSLKITARHSVPLDCKQEGTLAIGISVPCHQEKKTGLFLKTLLPLPFLW